MHPRTRRAASVTSAICAAAALTITGAGAAVAGTAPHAPASSASDAAGLLPNGPLHTDGNQLVDASGNPVRIASVGWFDAQYDIQQNVDQIVAAGFNAVRLPWVNRTMDDDLGRFDQVVAAAAKDGLKVILDNHSDEGGGNCDSQQSNGLWYDLGGASGDTDGCGVYPASVSDATFLADWQHVAQHYAGNDTVIGYDLRNEPLANPGQATWGDGNPDTDIRDMYQRVGDAIQAIDPDKLIITEGRISCGQNNQFGTCATDMSNLSDPSQRVNLTVPDKVVYSVHEYPNEISDASPDSGGDYVNRMNTSWGYLEQQDIAPVWVGEMGSSMQSGDSQGWASTLVPYLNGQDGGQGGPAFAGNQQPVSSSWWAWGNFDGEVPDGTLDSSGNLRPEQQSVYSLLQYHPTTGSSCTESANNATVTTAGPVLCDAAGNQWAIASDGTMTENGQTVQYSANVIELAYVDGTLWQENADHLWWAWTDDQWQPTDGTSTAPVCAASADDATVTTAGPVLCDSAGNQWAIASDGTMTENGQTVQYSANVIELAYVDGTLWQENSSNLWWSWSGGAWTPTDGTTTSPLP